MTDRCDRYRQLCSTTTIPLHLQAHWLDAVCGENGWDVVFAGNPDRPDGVWPFPKPDLFRRVGLPPFTSYGGPWLFYPKNASTKCSILYGFEKKVLAELAAGLPRWVLFRQNLLPEITNVLPLIWAGFKTSTRYTYRINPGTGVAAWWEKLESETRRCISISKSNFEINIDNDPDVLWFLHGKSLQYMRIRRSGSKVLFNRVFECVAERNQGLLFVARSVHNNEPMAAQWLLKSLPFVQFVLSGRNIAKDTGYLNYLMLAHCTRWALENNLGVDYEGSMHMGIEHVLRQMGGVLTPYFRACRYF